MTNSSNAAIAKRSSRDAALLHKLNTPLLPAFIALLFAFLLGGWVFSRRNMDARQFIVAGSLWSDKNVLGESFPIAPKAAGNDGQFYYRLALNPFSSTRTAYGITLDNPPYRQQRILYPLLAWCLSFGQAAALPLVLIGINVLAFCLIGFLGGCWAKELGKHAFWGVLCIMHLGFMFSFLSDLTEIVEIACVLLGLYLVQRQRWIAASLVLSLSVLAKETSLPIIFAAVLSLNAPDILKRRALNPQKLTLFAPLAVYAAVQIILKNVWGVFPVRVGGHNLGLPFQTLLPVLFSPFVSQGRIEITTPELWLCLFFVLAVSWQQRRSTISREIKWAWFLCALLFVSLSNEVLIRDIHFIRAFSEIYILGALIVMAASLRTRSIFLFCAFTVCLFRISLIR